MSAARETRDFLHVLVDPPEANVDIVAVHGLNLMKVQQHAYATWTAGGKLWLRDFLPERLPMARVLLFGYNANAAFEASEAGVNEQAANLLNRLCAKREGLERRPIVFVCHGVGGILLKQALVEAELNCEYRSVREATFGIAFFGTPHRGGRHAKLSSIIASTAGGVHGSSSSTLVKALQKNPLFADDLRENFRHQWEDYFILSFFENLPYNVEAGPIVGPESATLDLSGRRETKIAMDGHHADICKFSSADRDDYEQVAYNLVKLVEKAVSAEEESRQFEARHVESGARASSSKPFIVPYTDNSQFVGRDCTLAKLKCLMRPVEPDRRYLSRARAALFGLGGVGKSQIAIKYAYWLRKERPESSVFWVHASNVDRFRESFRQVAEVCKIPGYEEPKADILNLVKDWLKRGDGGEWLMIIDNADDIDMSFAQARTEDEDLSSDPQFVWAGLAQYIPDCSHGAILVTTRHERAGYDLVEERNLIEVSKMNETEASELLRKRLEGQVLDAEDLEKLAAQLDHLPLALAQAAAYMQNNTTSLGDYIAKLKDTPVELLDKHFVADGRASEISNAVTKTWWISFDQIQQQSHRAAEMLALMTFLDRQDIPRSLLEQKDESPSDFDKALKILTAFYLITMREGGRTFDLHRLVQLTTRRWLELKDKKEECARQALTTLSTRFPNGGHEYWGICAAYLPHTFVFLRQLIHYPSADAESSLKANLLHNLAWFMLERGQARDAKEFCSEAVTIRRHAIGIKHPKTLRNDMMRSGTYSTQGVMKEAEQLDVEVMKIMKEVQGARHPDTLKIMRTLASTYRHQGRLQEAEQLEVEVMEMTKEGLGALRPDTLTSMGNLALIYRKQRRLKKAEKLQVEVMETRKKDLGSQHPDTLTSMGDLATTYRHQGQSKEAEKLQVKVMNTRKELLGARHPDTLRTMGDLATTYRHQGRVKKAKQLEVEVMNITKKVQGARHPDTLRSMGNLAMTYRLEGRLRKAEVLQVEVMEMKKEDLGLQHPGTLTSMGDLAITYRRRGQSKEAEKLQVKVMNTRKELLGARHPDTLRTMGDLATTYRQQGQPKEAEELQVEIMEMRKEDLGPQHPDTLTSMENLAILYGSQGRSKEARSLDKDVKNLSKGAGDGSQVAGHSGEDETPDANSQDSTTPQDGEGAEEDGRDGRKRRTLVSRLLRCRKARESGVGPSSLRATKAGMRKN